MSADSKDHFDYIKSSYILRDTSDEAGNIIKSDFHDIKSFLNAFLNSKEIKDFQNIILGDLVPEEKTRSFKKYSDIIEAELSNFFNQHFPSQNNNWRFSFQIGSNKIHINVWDEITESYLSLRSRSDGFKWFLKLFIFIKNIQNDSMIIIDEPEKFLHASAQKELSSLFDKLKNEKNLQIIYATHSIFMLTNDIYPSLKIISKEKETSIIFNNINKYINSNHKNIKDTLLPITTSLGLNIYEVENIWQFKKYLLVEGEADIYTISLAYHISKIKKSPNIFIIPTTGKDNKYVSKIIKNILNSDFMCLYDGKISINEKKCNDIYIKDLVKSKNIENPEDLLDDKTKTKYEIDIKDKKGKIKPNHKIGWKKLYDDVKNEKYTLSAKEISDLSEFAKNINEKINSFLK